MALYEPRDRAHIHLEHPRRDVSRVPESMRYPSWLEDQISRSSRTYLLPDLDADLGLECAGVLVLVPVRAHRNGQDSQSYRMLGERDDSSGLHHSIMTALRSPAPPSQTVSPSSGDSTMRARWLPAPVMVSLLP